MPLLSKSKVVKCPDGSTRNILKDPKEAFQTEFSTWDARIKAIVNILSNNKADVDADIKKRTESIVQGLTESYATMQAQYCSAYLAYWSNPCSSETEKAWQSERNKILKKQTLLERMEKQLKAPVKVPAEKPAPTGKKVAGKAPAAKREVTLKNRDVSALNIKYIERLNSKFTE